MEGYYENGKLEEGGAVLVFNRYAVKISRH
jgi:hypothetical protein